MTSEMPEEIFLSINRRYPEQGAMYSISSVAGRPPFMGTRFIRADLAETVPTVTVDELENLCFDNFGRLSWSVMRELIKKYPNGIRIVP